MKRDLTTVEIMLLKPFKFIATFVISLYLGTILCFCEKPSQCLQYTANYISEKTLSFSQLNYHAQCNVT